MISNKRISNKRISNKRISNKRISNKRISTMTTPTLPLPPDRAPLWPIAVARMLIGVLWLFSLRWKLPPDFDGGSQRGLREWLELEVAHPVFSFYGNLIESVVIANFTFFAWLLFIAELAVGLSLLTGYRVRIGAAVGLMLAVNLGVGLAEVPGEWPWSYAMLAMWHGLFLVSDAGRVFGLDGRAIYGRTPQERQSE